MATTIVLASAGIILCIVLYLALCENYEDGIIGHGALGCMAFASGAPVYEVVKGHDYEFLPTTALFYAAVAIFLARHAYRFNRYRKTGEGEWNDEKRGTHRESQEEV